jgi:hypothetical protein
MDLVSQMGWRHGSTDFQKLSTRQLGSEEDFYRVIAMTLAADLGFQYDFRKRWVPTLGPNLNLDNFVRTLVAASDKPLVWFIDEADRLFTAPFASDFFGLIRSWHNARATDRRGPWKRLTMVIGYATEAYLFIRDLNQSPFNVGLAVHLDMFSLENLLDLNERYGKPFTASDLQRLYVLLGGQPFLTRRAFDLVTRGRIDPATLFATAARGDGPFSDHLKRVLMTVSELPVVWSTLTDSLAGTELPDSEGLQRLIAAGILVARSDMKYELPCHLYRNYLAPLTLSGEGR